MRTFRWSLFLLFLASCNFAPPYHRPEMDLAIQYRFAPEQSEEWVNLPWWEQFQDPVLNDLIRTALKNNHDLRAATATVLQFYAQYQIAFSQLLPQINIENQDERIRWNSQIPAVNYLYQLFGNLSYELDFWGKLRNQTASAQANFLAQVDSRLNVILTIVSALAKGYITLLQYDQELAISKMTLEKRGESQRIAQLRYEAGLTSLMELKQAQAQYEDAKVQINNFEELIPIQEDLISVLIGSQPQSIPRGKLLDNLAMLPQIPAGIPSDLLENRPDILQAEQNLLSANAQIGVARAAFFPVFNLTGTLGKQSAVWDTLLKQISNYSEWNVNATESIFTGGALSAGLSEAEAVFAQNYQIYQQTVLKALQQVSDALVSHEKSLEKLQIQQREIEDYKVYRKLSALRYVNGLNDYLTVVVAEQDLFNLELAAEETKGRTFLTLIDLYTALGQGWDVEADYCDKCDNPYPLWKALFF